MPGALALIIVVGGLLFTSFAVRAADPSVDGRFYGDGDNARYTLVGRNSDGWANLYTRLENNNVYVALVVDRSANDTVIGKWNGKPNNDRPYMQSAGWNRRPASQLMNSEYAEFTFTICEGVQGVEQEWNWYQAFAYDADGDENPAENDWRSDALGGPGKIIASPDGNLPPGMVAASSLTWNLNNYASGGSPGWDVTLGGARSGSDNWKSPYDSGNPNTVIGVSGYPTTGTITFDETHGWEWSMVYEWAVPLNDYIDDCPGEQLFVVSGNSHHSPTKLPGDIENIPIDEQVVSAYVDYGDLPATYSGASHEILVGSPYLGTAVDPDVSDQVSSDARGDDGSGSDEDGIAFPTPLIPGRQAKIEVVAGQPGYLSAYVDFDTDGSTLDAVTLVSATGPVSVTTGTISDAHLSAAGTYMLTIDVPSTAKGNMYARFRFTGASGEGGANASGVADNGEVEDYALATLGDYIWLDSNEDGIQDTGEAGLANVRVNLLDNNGNPVVDAAGSAISTVTDANGYYEFPGLPPGDYRIEVVKSSGYDFTTPGQGSGSNDSDVDASTGKTATISLSAGDDEDDNADAGLYEAPTAVTLAGFEAEASASQINVDWQTALELDMLGFNLYRSTTPDGEKVLLNSALISSDPAGMTGAQYSFIDSDVVPGQTYYYWLEMVETNSASLVGPVEVTAAYGLYLPTVLKH